MPLEAIHLFLELPAHSLQEPRWAKKTLSSKYWGSVLWPLLPASDHRGVAKQAGGHCCTSPIATGPSPSSWSAMGFKGPVPFPSPFNFSFSALGSQTLKTRIFKSNYIKGENLKVTTHSQVQAEKTLIYASGWSLVQRQSTTTKEKQKQQILGNESNLISRDTTLLDPNVQF